MPIKKDKAPSGNATSVTVVASQRVVPSSQRETYVAIGGGVTKPSIDDNQSFQPALLHDGGVDFQGEQVQGS